MIVESWAVLVLILVMSYSYLRTGKQSFSIAVLPLTAVPFMYIVSVPIASVIENSTSYSGVLSRAFLVVASAVIACSFFAITAHKMKKKSHKMAFLLMCGGFTVIFAWVLLLDIIAPLIK